MCGRDVLWGWRGSARAVNPLLPKCLQGQSFEADMEVVNLSKPCCSVAPGGLYGKAPPLWHGVLCPAWQNHLPRLVPMAPTLPPPTCSRPCHLPLTQAHLLLQVQVPPSLGSLPWMRSSSGAEDPAFPMLPRFFQIKSAPKFPAGLRA